MAYIYEKKGKWYMGYTDERGVAVQRSTKIKVGVNRNDRRASEKAAQEDAEAKERLCRQLRDGTAKPEKPAVAFSVAAWRYLKEYARQFESYKSIEGRFTKHWLLFFGDRPIASILPSEITAVLLGAKEPRTYFRVDEWIARTQRVRPFWFLRAEDAQAFIAKRQGCTGPIETLEKGLEPQSRKHLLNTLKAFFRWCIEDAKLVDGPNPCDTLKVKVPKRSPTPLKREWIVPVLQCFPDEDRGLAAAAVMTGCRAGELRAALVDSVDLEQLCLVVRGSNERNTTKDGEERTVHFGPELVPFLRVELGRARSKWLFPDRNGNRRRRDEKLANKLRVALMKAGIIEGYNHSCTTANGKAGCGHTERRADGASKQCERCSRAMRVTAVPRKYTFKDLRSTWATTAGEQLGDTRIVQEQLGHASPNTTLRYEKVNSVRAARVRSISFAPSGPASAGVGDRGTVPGLTLKTAEVIETADSVIKPAV